APQLVCVQPLRLPPSSAPAAPAAPAPPVTPTTTTARSGTAATAATASSASTPTRASAPSAATPAGPICAPGVTPRGWLRLRRPALGRLATRARRRRHSVGWAGAPRIARTGGPRRRRGDLNHASRTGAAEQRPLRDAEPRTDAHHRGRSGEAVLEYQTAPRTAAPALRAVDEQELG